MNLPLALPPLALRHRVALAPLRRGTLALLCMVALSGCGSLLPATPAAPELYALDGAATAGPRAASALATPASAPGRALRTTATLVVDAPRAAPGYDSSRLIYVREPHRLEAYAYSQWVDPPAKMLQPLIAGAIERSGTFGAVVSSPSSATGDWRLGVELLRLQHEFAGVPSQAHLMLRVHLVDAASRAVVASRDIDVRVPAASEDPYGGVVAANRAVADALEQLTAFVAAAVPAGAPAPLPAGAAPPATAAPLASSTTGAGALPAPVAERTPTPTPAPTAARRARR